MDATTQKIISLCSNLFGKTKSEAKKNNKSVDELMRIFDALKGDKEQAEQIYFPLLKHESDKVRFEAAICCIKLDVRIREATQVLQEISKRNPEPIIRFSAEMVLETWEEKGYLV